MGVHLTSTSDLVRVVTDVAVTVDVHASWADVTSSATTPGRTNTLISTATTTTVVASPAASTYRTLKTLTVRNRGTTLACNVTVVHSDGTNIPELIKVNLSPGDTLCYDEHRGWFVRDQAYGRDLVVVDRVAGAQVTGDLRVVTLDRDVVNNCATADQLLSVPGLQFPVEAGGHRYYFRAVIMYTSDATTTGARWSIFGDSVQTTMIYKWEASLTTTTKTNGEGFTGYDSPSAANGSTAATGSNIAIVEGFIDTTRQDSTISIRCGSEVAGAAITAKAGSFILWQRMS